jgi:hypothetical protein
MELSAERNETISSGTYTDSAPDVGMNPLSSEDSDGSHSDDPVMCVVFPEERR